MFTLPVEHYDRIITAFPWRDKVIVISERGAVSELKISEEDGATFIRRVE